MTVDSMYTGSTINGNVLELRATNFTNWLSKFVILKWMVNYIGVSENNLVPFH